MTDGTGTCTNCGVRAKAAVKFCGECGHAQGPDPGEASVVQASRPRRLRATILASVLMLGVAGVGAAAYLAGADSGPSQTDRATKVVSESAPDAEDGESADECHDEASCAEAEFEGGNSSTGPTYEELQALQRQQQEFQRQQDLQRQQQARREAKCQQELDRYAARGQYNVSIPECW